MDKTLIAEMSDEWDLAQRLKFVSTTNWHLPRALPVTEQRRYLSSASSEIEPHAAIAIDLQQSLRAFKVE